MKKVIFLITILFISCQKKETTITKATVKSELEKGDYWSIYTRKESSVLKYKIDTLNLFYDEEQLNRVEVKVYSESYGDTPSGYIRYGYHINKQNFLDAVVYITDTLKVNTISDYPRRYEERYEFYRKNYTFSYMSSDGKKRSNYFKSTETPSKGYFKDLLALDIVLSKVNFPLQKLPKSLYEIKNNNEELYVAQDSIKVYDLENTNKFKVISSSVPFNYLREIKVKKEGAFIRYFAKISLKNEGLKYVNLKEIENVQTSDPRQEIELFVTAPKGLEMYDNSYSSNFFGNKEYLIVKLPYAARVEKESDYDTEYRYVNGIKGNLIYAIYVDDKGESHRGVVFSGYLSINKPI